MQLFFPTLEDPKEDVVSVPALLNLTPTSKLESGTSENLCFSELFREELASSLKSSANRGIFKLYLVEHLGSKCLNCVAGDVGK